MLRGYLMERGDYCGGGLAHEFASSRRTFGARARLSLKLQDHRRRVAPSTHDVGGDRLSRAINCQTVADFTDFTLHILLVFASTRECYPGAAIAPLEMGKFDLRITNYDMIRYQQKYRNAQNDPQEHEHLAFVKALKYWTLVNNALPTTMTRSVVRIIAVALRA